MGSNILLGDQSHLAQLDTRDIQAGSIEPQVCEMACLLSCYTFSLGPVAVGGCLQVCEQRDRITPSTIFDVSALPFQYRLTVARFAGGRRLILLRWYFNYHDAAPLDQGMLHLVRMRQG